MVKKMINMLAITLIAFQSCQKMTQNDTEVGDKLGKTTITENIFTIADIDVKVKNGTLHFTETSDIIANINKITDMNGQEFAKFEKEAGYKSLASSLEEAYEAFDKLKTEDDLEAWQNKYKDIVELRDSIVTPLIQGDAYQKIANRSGEYFLGDAYVKVTEEKLITIVDGDKTKLTQALNLNESELDNGIMINKIVSKRLILDNNLEGEISPFAAPCFLGGEISGGRQEGNRKVFLNFTVGIYGGIWDLAGQVEVEASAHKKGLFGWNKYKTKYRIEDVSFSIVNGLGQTITAAASSGGNSSDAYEFILKTPLGDNAPLASYVGPSNFGYAKGRATSRGTVPYWATVGCNATVPSDYGHYTF